MKCFRAAIILWAFFASCPTFARDECLEKVLEVVQPTTPPQSVEDLVALTNLQPGVLKSWTLEQQRQFYEKNKVFYRGIALSSEQDMVRLLQGDRNNELRSWMYSKNLSEKIAAGVKPSDAMIQTDQELLGMITQDLKALGAEQYTLKQAAGTTNFGVLGTGTAIPFAPLDSQAVVGYAVSVMHNKAQAQGGKFDNLYAGVIVLKERKPRGLPRFTGSTSGPKSEYYVLSNVPAQDVDGIYVGYPQDSIYNLHWYYIRVDTRNAEGLAQNMTLIEMAKGTMPPAAPKAGAVVITQFGPDYPVSDQSRADILKKFPDLKNFSFARSP